MARYITFNGITLVHPGALSKVDVSALAQVGSSINGIIGLIGEADGGEPDHTYTLDDGTTAKSIFRSGPMADAINLCFQPANDPRIPGGAFRVKCRKTNNSTQSSFTLTDGANNVLTLTSVDYGSETTQISFEFETDPVDTDRRMLTQYDPDGTTEQITDVGDRPLMDLVYKGPEEPVSLTTDTITAPGNSGLGTRILWASATANDIGKHVICTGSAGGAGVAALGCIRRITAANVGVSIDVDTAFFDLATGAPVAETGGASQQYKVVVKILSPIQAAVVNAPAGATQVIDLQDQPDAVTITGARTISVAGPGGVAQYDLWLRVMSGPGQGQIRQITIAANVGTTMRLTVTAFETANQPTAAGSTFGIIMVDSSTGTITGASGAATTLTTTTTTATGFGAAGAGETETPPADLAYTLTSKTISDVCFDINALKVYVSQVSAGGQWSCTVGNGRSGSLNANRFDFDATNATVALTWDKNYTQHISTDKNHRFLDNLATVVDTYNDQSGIVTAVRSTGGAAQGAGLPQLYTTPTYLTGGARGVTTNTDFQDNFDAFLQTRVNIVVPLISYNLSVDGLGSTALFDTIAAQLVTHVNTAAGAGKSERNGYIGQHATGGSALTTILATASTLNNKNISLACQMPTVLDVDGNLESQSEWAMACLFAGIQAGTPIGEPSTFKYIRASAVDQDSTLDPTDRTISNQLQLGGVMIVEPGTNDVGFRVVRCLTTYLADDNVAYTDVNVNEVINYISYELRTQVENRFTGLKGTPARIADVKDFVGAWLEQARTDEIIVDSTDDTGASVHAWHTLRVTLSGDILRIVFQCYPVLGINYETIEAFAQLPVISA